MRLLSIAVLLAVAFVNASSAEDHTPRKMQSRNIYGACGDHCATEGGGLEDCNSDERPVTEDGTCTCEYSESCNGRK